MPGRRSGPAATIRDVARLARVAPAIVSRVVNGDKALTIRNETRERVLTAVRQLNYRPNVIARSLKLRASYALGMLLPDIANPMFPDIIKGVEDMAEVEGFHILLSHITSQALVGGRHLELLRESRVAGLIVATGRSRTRLSRNSAAQAFRMFSSTGGRRGSTATWSSTTRRGPGWPSSTSSPSDTGTSRTWRVRSTPTPGSVV